MLHLSVWARTRDAQGSVQGPFWLRAPPHNSPHTHTPVTCTHSDLHTLSHVLIHTYHMHTLMHEHMYIVPAHTPVTCTHTYTTTHSSITLTYTHTHPQPTAPGSVCSTVPSLLGAPTALLASILFLAHPRFLSLFPSLLNLLSFTLSPSPCALPLSCSSVVPCYLSVTLALLLCLSLNSIHFLWFRCSPELTLWFHIPESLNFSIFLFLSQL